MLGIGDLDIGVSSKGMDGYIDELKIEFLQKTSERIDDVKELEAAIKGIWQGASCDKFLEQFKKSREVIKDDLQDEYRDVKNRLTELRSYFFEQDQNMMGGK